MNEFLICCAILSGVACGFTIKLFQKIKAQLVIWLMIAFIYGTVLNVLLTAKILPCLEIADLMLIFWTLITIGIVGIYLVVKKLR